MNRKVREHFMYRLGIGGELISMNAKDRAPGTPRAAADELRRMMADNLIRYYRHSDRKRTFRICDPAGIDELGQIDPLLKEHAELIIGQKFSRYPGNRQYRIKKRKEAMLMNAFLDSGFTVDGVVYENGTFTRVSPTLVDAREIIRSAPADRPLFISGAVLKKSAPGIQHARRELSISPGAVFSSNGVLTVYTIATARFRWFAASETQTASEITRLYEDAADKKGQRSRRLRALIIADNKKTAADILALTGDRDSNMNPLTIFRLCYMVPNEDEKHTMDIAEMLTIKDWKEKTNRILGLDGGDGQADGITEDGRSVYNLLCCNLGRMRELEPKIKRGSCRLVVHDWQKEIMEEVYGELPETMVLSPFHFKGLLVAARRI